MSITLPQFYHIYGNLIDVIPEWLNTCGMPNFGKNLKALRESRGFTQDEVAEALGVDQETISRLERSSAPPKRGNTYRRLVEFYEKAPVLPVDPASKFPADLRAKTQEIERRGPSKEWTLSPPPPIATVGDIPILASSPAGRMSKPKELGKILGHVPRQLYPDDPNAFAVVVHGDSMTPWVNEGDIVVATYLRNGFPNGMPCVVRELSHAGEYCDTIKYVFEAGPGRVKLVPRNIDAYPATEREAAAVTCFPIMLRVFRDYLRLNLGASGQSLVMPQHPLGEGPQPFPDHENPDERHPE